MNNCNASCSIYERLVYDMFDYTNFSRNVYICRVGKLVSLNKVVQTREGKKDQSRIA